MRLAHVAHHLPGRIRLKLANVESDVALLEKVERALSAIPAVNRIRVNPITGSFVVEYDPDQYSKMLELTAKATAQNELLHFVSPEASEAQKALDALQLELVDLAQHSVSADFFLNAVSQINAGVKRATGNVIDLRVLLPLCLSAYSLASDKERPSPLWVTLLIFSFNAFVSLHPPRPAPLV